jgi:hypothetical protein
LDLKGILCIKETRVVANDFTISLYGKKYQIQPGSFKAGLKRSKVEVQKRLDGKVKVKYKDQYLHVHEVF